MNAFSLLSRIPAKRPAGVSLRVTLPLLLLLLLVSACRKETGLPEGRIAPNPKAAALYGPPRGSYSTNIARRLAPGPTSNDWQGARFSILETELSPATLVHSSTSYLGLFTGLNSHGLGPPAYIAWSTASGPRTFKRGESLDVTHIEENWLLLWFAGSPGWTQWDSPWAVFLQHKPTSMKLDEGGLHLTFPQRAGDVVVMPLYGYYKPPAQGADYLDQHGLPGKKIKTWEWPAALTRDPLMRLRYWAGATRSLPVYCKDSFSLDRGGDSVTIRSQFEFHQIKDDWGTKPLKLAPLSPALSLALVEPGFPATFSGKPFDMEIPTPFGPLTGVQAVESFDATLSVLQYVHETEQIAPVSANSPTIAREALDRLRAAARAFFQATQNPPASPGTKNDCDALETWGWLARALPYFEEATRVQAGAWLKSHLDQWLSSFTADSTASTRCNSGAFEVLWAYAHHSDDWALVEKHWPLLRAQFHSTAKTRWAAFAIHGDGMSADHAAGLVAFARIAYRLGDLDAYAYGCYTFARQLVHLCARQRGAAYFRLQQPWHSMEFMDENVFLTGLTGGLAGWQMDGPNYPMGSAQRRFPLHWKGFSDPDIGRFYQDYLKPDLQRELAWLEPRWEPLRETNGLPSMSCLRSLLLNEPPSLISTNRAAEIPGAASVEVIARSLLLLRVAQPVVYQRLIPGGPPTAFLPGFERDSMGPNPQLLTAVQLGADGRPSTPNPAGWPELVWPEWKTGKDHPWSFGHIRAVRSGPAPQKARELPLNWNSRATLLELP